MLNWLKKKIASSPSMVVTGPGVLKTHDVEARFRSEEAGLSRFYGKLKQSRWSDGQERFTLRLKGFRADHDGKLRLFLGDDLVSEFDVSGTNFEFRWKGTSTDSIPQFNIGDRVRIDIGTTSIKSVVEPD